MQEFVETSWWPAKASLLYPLKILQGQDRWLRDLSHWGRRFFQPDRGSEMTRCFLDTGESNDLDLLISWMHNQFLKPILYGLEEEMSRSRLENWLEHLQKQSARFRELTSAAKHPNKKKFAERWNSEIDTAISLIREQLRRLEDSTRDYL